MNVCNSVSLQECWLDCNTHAHQLSTGGLCRLEQCGRMTETGWSQTILGSIDPGAAKLCTVHTEVNDESDVRIYSRTQYTSGQMYVI